MATFDAEMVNHIFNIPDGVGRGLGGLSLQEDRVEISKGKMKVNERIGAATRSDRARFSI